MGAIKKISTFCNRVIESTGEYAGDADQFGSAVARAKWKKKISGNDSKKSVEKLASFVRSALLPLTERYSTTGYESTLCAKKELTEIPIWFCWLQGEEYMPESVRLCYSKARHLAPANTKVHLVTLKNVKDYLDFPPVIEEKYYNRLIHLNSLTDMLHASLLCAYGGVWIDPMLYIARAIDNEMLHSEFFSPKLHYAVPSDPSQGLWNSMFLVVQKNSVVMNYIREAFTLWWETYDAAIDERQFDYFMLNAYRELPTVGDVIDSVQPNNIPIDALQLLLDQPFSAARLRALETQCSVFDISSDSQWNKQTESGEETLYGYLCRSEFE